MTLGQAYGWRLRRDLELIYGGRLVHSGLYVQNVKPHLPPPGAGRERNRGGERLERLEPFERRELFENYFCLVSQIL